MIKHASSGSIKVAATLDERTTVPDLGSGLTTLEDYKQWLLMRQQDTAAFHIEQYGPGVACKAASTMPPAA